MPSREEYDKKNDIVNPEEFMTNPPTTTQQNVSKARSFHERKIKIGGIKRHHFKRGPMTHGSKSHRALGSIGAGTTPGHVYKGKKMPGRMGGTKRKIRKLKIVKVDNDLNVVMIKGAVPGKPGNLLRITPAKIVGKNIPKS
nr:50s ribosomal protein l3-1, chloroplastic [Quercus suber]